MRFKKTLATGVAALCAGSLMLTGCSNQKVTSSGPNSGDKADTTNLQLNSKTRDEMEKGGTLRLTVGSMGGNFNTWHNDGNTTDTLALMRSIDQIGTVGCFKMNAKGEYVLNKDFCEDAKEEIKDGKQVVTVKFNPQAKFNDGTPLDVKTFQNMVKVLQDPKSNITFPPPYKGIQEVKAGADDREVVITMNKTYEPFQDIVGGFFHPAINTPDVFNKGLVENIHPEWKAGPFKLETYDAAKKTLTVVPNEKWWGEQPQLDRIVFVEMASKAEVPAYRNGQIDVTGAGNINRFNQLKGVKDSEIRIGHRTSVFGLILNTKSPELADKAIRKAIYQGLNRTAIADIRYKGLDWKEPKPGSWIAMPFASHYKDNYPVADGDAKGAKETLTAAGYTLGTDGFFTKGGKTVTVTIVTFGDDPVSVALVTAIQSQLKDAGIKVAINQRAESAFNEAMAKRDWAISFSGYTVGSDATGAPAQFYGSKDSSNMTGCGTEEIDKRIAELPTITDAKERNAKALEVEGDWQKECFGMLPIMSGPSMLAVNKYLANYGPALFQTLDWTMLGWEKGHKRG